MFNLILLGFLNYYRIDDVYSLLFKSWKVFIL